LTRLYADIIDILDPAKADGVQILTAVRDTGLAIVASRNLIQRMTLDPSQSPEEVVGVETYSLPIGKYDLIASGNSCQCLIFLKYSSATVSNPLTFV
jgi:hypothetical protein